MLGEDYEEKKFFRWRRTVLSWEGWTVNGGITPTQGSTAFCSQLPDVFKLFSQGLDDHFFVELSLAAIKPFLELTPLILDGLEDKLMTFPWDSTDFQGLKGVIEGIYMYLRGK